MKNKLNFLLTSGAPDVIINTTKGNTLKEDFTMYSEALLRIAKENGYELRSSIKNLDGYCKVAELVSASRRIPVGRYSSIENFQRSDEDIINDILHPVNYEEEFDKLFGIS